MPSRHNPIKAGWEWVVEKFERAASAIGLHSGTVVAAAGTRGTGTKAENAAGWYLDRRGYRILERNWWAPGRRGEIDLIAIKHGTLIAVEVKSYPAGQLTPSEALSEAKRRKLVSLIKQYARGNGHAGCSLRVDLITVEWDDDGRPGRVEHLQSVATDDG